MLKPKVTELITEEDCLQGELINDVKHELNDTELACV
ncbi:protein of unknown function [Methylotuvimicrobium alcaliphilum 20Z]|uniref:Uncharacterized protein n=1 Tax=Methylotuvimicrobium alcaliphilum (strain DSM 19304 / NCIMB 14124 / VKM B-2133 / 20Z) TaxID=1091494 RepID=G4SUQ7_META2|nr:protein of unknown function [Methylotuvimicrobium alcaliphilum 20Z]